MFTYLTRKKENFIFLYGARVLVFILSFSLIFAPSAGYAQSVFVANLPVPGTMVPPSPAFVPVLLKGMTIHPENPLQFDFIVDSGNTDFKEDQIKEESQRLVKYFLASMTIPKDDLWVNLSPYESDKIIPDELGKTELGRDMLAQDYILKQLTASLMYPEKELGKEFWSKVYQKAQEKYGTTEIPVDTFNKVWILPETATVYEHGQTVYIVDAKLRVMLDIDYMAQRSDPRSPMLDPRESSSIEHPTSSIKHPESSIETEIIREIILPEIEREVNEGQNFAPLRQIYHSLILAKWYKETIKNSLLSKVYVDQRKTAGVESGDETLKDQIYAQYMEAYKKGVFNYIKEDYDRLSNETIPRKYFSGGEQLTRIPITKTDNPVAGNGLEGKGYKATVVNTPQKNGITVATKSSSPILESPYKFDSLADGRDYQIPNLVLGQPNLFTQIGFLGDFIIKVPSKRGMADFKKYVKEETPDPENIRGNEFLEHFNNLSRALERFPEFKTARDQFGDDIAHFLVVHRLQNERLKASGIIGVPETRFVILELPGRFWGKTIVPAVVQKKIEGVSLWDMVDPMSGEFKPLFLSVRDKIKKQLEPLIDSSLSIHVDWNIQNFVWSQAEERLYYVDSKPTTIASKFGVNHNLNSLREVFIEHSQSSSPITLQEAQAMIKAKLTEQYPDHPEYANLITDEDVQQVIIYDGNVDVRYHSAQGHYVWILDTTTSTVYRESGSMEGMSGRDEWVVDVPESIEIVRGEKLDQSSSPITGEKLNQVKKILSMFGINEIENANELDGGVGSQDKPIHIFSPQGEMVLRKSRYKEPQLKFIVSVMNRLKSEGIPVPTLYYREGGDVLQSESYIADYQGSRYTLEEYLTTGKNIPLEDVSRDQFIEIAQLAAKINNALSGFQPQGNKRFKSRTEIAEDLQTSFAEYKRMAESLPVDQRQEGHILFGRYSDFFINQLEIFLQKYDASAQKTSITHSDLHPGNIKFDDMGKIVGLIDFDFTITDHRVIEFNNLIMGKDDVAKDLPYSRDKMLAMVSAYNRAVNDKLNDAEIKAIVEVIRLRFLEEIHSRFVRENFHIPTNIFEHPDQLPFAYTSISLFEQFAEDFSTDEKIQTFVDEVNSSGASSGARIQSNSPATFLKAVTDKGLLMGRMLQEWDNLHKKDPNNNLKTPSEFFKNVVRKPRGNFIVHYNPLRAGKRKPTSDQISNVYRPREPRPNDEKDWSYKKAADEPIFRNQIIDQVPVDIRIQPKPLAPNGHFLVIPDPDKVRPQFLTEKDIQIALRVLQHSAYSDHLKMAFNSWGAFGAVNQLHLHGLFYSDIKGHPSKMPVENFETTKSKNRFFTELEKDYPVRTFVFKGNDVAILSSTIFKAIQVLQVNNQPHNLIFTKTAEAEFSVYLFPRKFQEPSPFGTGTGIAFIELGGELIVTVGKEDQNPNGNTPYEDITKDSFKNALEAVGLEKQDFDQLKDKILKSLLNPAVSLENSNTIEQIKKREEKKLYQEFINKNGVAPHSPDQPSPSDTSGRSSPSDTPQSSSPAIQGMGDRGKGMGIIDQRVKGVGLADDEQVGGIDMNAIDLDRDGGGVDIQFDPAQLQELIDAGIDGFAPVIINITPLPSVLPLLGLEPRKEEDTEELSLLN